jgi:hypothetical protein
MIPYVDVQYAQQQRESREKRNKHFLEGLEATVKRAMSPLSPKSLLNPKNINPNVPGLDLIAAVHEERSLNQMVKARDNNNPYLFWENQKKFLAFIDPKKPYITSEKASIGFKIYPTRLLSNNPNYARPFINFKPGELSHFRTENWKKYNLLCQQMYGFASKHQTLDNILIRI